MPWSRDYKLAGKDRVGNIEDGVEFAANGGSQPDIAIAPEGSGSKATVYTSGITISGITSGDSATVFQNAINALSVQNNGKGGVVQFRGQHIWSSSVTLYAGVSLVGTGPNGNKNVQNTGAAIQSSFNGNALVITGTGASNAYFPFLSNFSMWGKSDGTLPNQNLIYIDASGGANVFDVFLDHVTTFNAGLNNLALDAAVANTKVWIDDCYFESAGQDGINVAAGHLAVTNSYIFGCGRYGVWCDNTGTDLFIQNNRLWSNVSGGVFTVHTSECILTGNSFDTNGSNSSSTPQVMAKNTPYFVMNDNIFNDARGASACNYHARLAFGGAIGLGVVAGNVFGPGGQTQKIYKDYVLADKVFITDNPGYNDSFGKLATPFNTAHIGMEGGGVAAPTASTDYRVVGTPLFCVFSGGTGVSITIKDAAANTVTSGLTSYTGPLPVGYTINFGAFSVAPTVYVGVV